MAKNGRARIIFVVVVGIVLLFSAVFYVYWDEKETPVLVGFTATLSGPRAELGIQERNGVLMAVEDINKSGGIAGRQVQVAVIDDKGDEAGAREACTTLIDQKVVGIIGHATSSQTMVGKKIADASKVVMVSPTASSSRLAKQDDYLFRVVDNSTTRAKELAKFIREVRNIKSMVIIRDIENEGFTKNYEKALVEGFEAVGGEVVQLLTLSSSDTIVYSEVVSALQQGRPESVFIIAKDRDTAYLCQNIRMAGWDVPIFTSSLALTPTLIANGGRAVEGIVSGQSAWLGEGNNILDAFKERYKQTYGNDAAFGAIFGYEAAMVLFHGLQKTEGQKEGLKRALLSMRDEFILTDPISYDEYGDVARPFTLIAVEGGRFKLLE